MSFNKFKYSIILSISALLLLACAGSQVRINLSVGSAKQFYMEFRRAATMEERKAYVQQYQNLTEAAFSDHVMRMVTDLSFRDMAPVEYRRAVTIGMVMGRLYAEIYGDTKLQDIFEKWKAKDAELNKPGP